MTKIILYVLLKNFFPFLVLALSFLLYKKQNDFMKRFYYRMTSFYHMRRFYALTVLFGMILVNEVCFMDNPNYSVGISTAMAACFAIPKVADRVLHRLHESRWLFIVSLILALICYATSVLDSVYQTIFITCMASIFYPSEKILSIYKGRDENMTQKELMDQITQHYY